MVGNGWRRGVHFLRLAVPIRVTLRLMAEPQIARLLGLCIDGGTIVLHMLRNKHHVAASSVLDTRLGVAELLE